MSHITVKEALAYGREALGRSHVPSIALDCRVLLEYVTGFSREAVAMYPERILSEEQWDRFQEMIARRSEREPVAQLLRRKEFWGLDFYVTRDTLCPRPDSETLIEAVLGVISDKSANIRILDLGTGSGCLLLSVLSEFPRATGIGVDISPEALEVARRNGQNLGFAARTEWMLCHWGEGVCGTFDIIISNPPYIEDADIATLEPEVSRYEPRLALSGGNDGLACYRNIAPVIARLLKKNGIAVLEFGQGQEDAVTHIMAAHHLKKISEAQDMGGITRCIIIKKDF